MGKFQNALAVALEWLKTLSWREVAQATLAGLIVAAIAKLFGFA